MSDLVTAALHLALAIMMIAILAKSVGNSGPLWTILLTSSLAAPMFIFTIYYIGEYYNWK